MSLHAYVEALREDLAELSRRWEEAVQAHLEVHDRRAVPGLLLDVPAIRDPDEPSLEEMLRPPRYKPAPVEIQIAQRHPEIDWLVHMPPEERSFWNRRDGVSVLLARYPDVEEEAWVTLLRTAG